MKNLIKNLVLIFFSLSAFSQENTLLLQKEYKQELENVKLQLQQLGYCPMPVEMQVNILVEIQGVNSSLLSKSQVGNNVFSSIDNTINYYTLSKNKFPEIVNQLQHDIYELQLTTLNSQLTTQIDPSTFALSIDPLAEKFPSISPYNSMGNNPVNRIDPSGLADIGVNENNPLNDPDKYVNIVIQDQGVIYTHKDKLGYGADGRPNTLDGYTSTFLGLSSDQLLKVQLDKNYNPQRGSYENLRESMVSSQKTLGVVFIHAEAIQPERIDKIVNSLLIGQKTDENSLLFISSCFLAGHDGAAEELALRTGLPIVAAYGGVNHTRSISKDTKVLEPDKIFSGGYGWVVIVPVGNDEVIKRTLPRGWYTLEEFQAKIKEIREQLREGEKESTPTQTEHNIEDKKP